MTEEEELLLHGIFLPTYTLPETNKPIWIDFCTIDVLHIPATCTQWPDFSDTAIGHFEVHPENPFFTTVDGIVYSKDGKTLIAYPGLKDDTHFDVPFGVKEIAPFAFFGNGYLQSVSFPLSLQAIGEMAFAYCTGLASLNLPLSVQDVGPHAFSGCTNLEKVSMGESLRSLLSDEHHATCFVNCEKLEKNLPFSGNEGNLLSLHPDDVSEMLLPKPLRMVASPENANSYVRARKTPTEDGSSAGSYNSGDVVIIEKDDLSTKDYFHGFFGSFSTEGYLKKSYLVPAPGETLFHITSVLPKNDQVKVMAAGFKPELGQHVYTDVTYARFKEKLFADTNTSSLASFDLKTDFYHTDHVATAQMYIYSLQGEQAADITFSVLDAVFEREKTGDQKTFGVVVASKKQNRVHLRKKATQSSDSLGKFFTGTQLEIIGEKGDFYQVLVNGLEEGWMMKKFVRIVPQMQ